MASSSAARSRRCRERARAGKMMVWAELEADELREVLIAGGLLAEWDQENHLAINYAFQTAVKLWVGRELAKLKDLGLF